MIKNLQVICLLGLLLSTGCGRDELSQLKKDARNGDAEAQRLLGAKYYSGTDVVQNYAESERLYLLSAEQGNLKAQHHLGLCYYSGKGVSQDYKKAVKWLRNIAEKGDAKAQVLLGSCYFIGKGVQKDYAMAYAWCNTSINQQDKNAKKIRDYCMNGMTARQKEKARNLSTLYEKKFVK